MTATVAMVAELRRMVNEPDDSNGYDDDLLTSLIEEYPLVDERGEQAYTWDTTTTPPSQTANTSWLATYDLHAAAGRVWEEKAGSVADEFDFSADGAAYDRAQKYAQRLQMARFHNARRAPKSRRIYVWPKTKLTLTN